ncbi:MAG: lipoate--protein ligase family protein [Planctomycetes bacterium]|nr:lipoate--protein ligase family protein [Planctomycetota bacterium]
MTPARVIFDAAHDGAWNMTADHWLAEHAATAGRAVLRFYQWSPATLSLGYFQQHAERARHAASERVAWVRRSSGGGAILHDRELTYSLAMPVAAASISSTQALYDAAHGSLIATLAGWGVTATLCHAPAKVSPSNEAFLCFQRRAEGDVLVGDQKVAGSAQRRLGDVVLQHGSVLLAHSEFTPELPGINDLCGTRLSADELARAWLPRLAEACRLQVTIEPFTAAEQEQIAAQVANRFGNDAWNQRR